MSGDLYIGIDGGQTSTKSVLADENGHILALGSGTPCDHIQGVHGIERNRAAIHSAVQSVMDAAHIDPARIAGVGMAITGAAPELGAEMVFAGIIREILQPEYLWIDHDVAGNLAGAAAGEPGVVVIAGGGSIAYGINATGTEWRAGGMGYLMGDEGSGWWIGLQAIQAAGKAADGRGPHTELLPMVLDHFGFPTIRHVISLLYGPDFTRDQVAALVPDVARLAHADGIAAEIMSRAGVLLADAALAVIHHLYEPGDEVSVYPTGGVFRSGDILTVPFAERLLDEWPGVLIRQPQYEPVFGALLRIWQASGIEITPERLGRLHLLP
ncbi:MAG: hypothetical protein KC435_07500 [Thermomicrobiales bacterium]|nr:hypothetical protein [Thermomicrobiales bacterium]